MSTEDKLREIGEMSETVRNLCEARRSLIETRNEILETISCVRLLFKKDSITASSNLAVVDKFIEKIDYLIKETLFSKCEAKPHKGGIL